jgi:hypothetical protein
MMHSTGDAIDKQTSSRNNVCLPLSRKQIKVTVYPVIKTAPRYEDLWGSGGIAPRILNLGNRWSG